MLFKLNKGQKIMKLKKMLSFPVLLVLLASVLSSCFMTQAESYDSGYISVPDENLTVVSEAIDTLTRAGYETRSVGNHGAHQTRLVSVSSGTYMAVSLEPSIQLVTCHTIMHIWHLTTSDSQLLMDTMQKLPIQQTQLTPTKVAKC